METVEIAFDLTSTDYSAKLSFSVVLNDKTIIDITHVDQETPIKFSIDIDEGDHELKLIMKNKLVENTTVDENNNIVKDVCLGISNFSIDNIELNNSIIENTIYHHDFNGTADPIEDQFYGSMGCNGTVVLKFSSPVYIWLLNIM
tara:strand:- start:44 stop:478 length:435 start_codon:yes stop_codon:yes gene_type:complete